MKTQIQMVAHDQERTITLEVLRLEQEVRSQRAWKFFGYGMGAAVVSVIIPILHFFLVPGLLIGSPILAWKIYKREWDIPQQKIDCLHCQKATEVKARFTAWPIYVTCSQCRGQLRLETFSG